MVSVPAKKHSEHLPMPELPEVETIKRDLEKLLDGKTVRNLTVKDTTVLTGISPKGTPRRNVKPDQIKSNIVGKKISCFHRRGKYLIMEFTDQSALIFHLRMTGQIRIGMCSQIDRMSIEFERRPNLNLHFIDQRRFGDVVYSKYWRDEEFIRSLGIEPLNGHLTAPLLKQKFRRRSAPIHSLLLNQHLISGLGNIYAAESLFHAGINPHRAAGRVPLSRLEGLCTAIQMILKKSIGHRGYSMNTYVDAFGRKGSTQKFTAVYDKEGKPCVVCGNSLKRSVISGRGVVYCPICQK